MFLSQLQLATIAADTPTTCTNILLNNYRTYRMWLGHAMSPIKQLSHDVDRILQDVKYTQTTDPSDSTAGSAPPECLALWCTLPDEHHHVLHAQIHVDGVQGAPHVDE